MKPLFSKFKIRDILSLCGVIVVGFGWLLVDQYFLAESYQRFIALFFILLGLLFLQFSINKPEDPIRYANTIALICVSFIVFVSVLMHVIIKHDFTSKSVLIWVVSGVMPYVAGGLYSLTRKNAL
jgi:peptidoglycan/LPS O-acetylase OafA/YrhL